MSKLIVTGYQVEATAKAAKQLQADVVVSTSAQNPQVVSENEFAGAAACLVHEPMCLPGLADTMTCRAFFEQIKNCGVTTILTAVRPAGDAPSWLMYYGMALPFVDVFFAPYNEALAMLEPDNYDSLKDKADPEMCDCMSLSVLNMGCALVVFDLGEAGYYLRSSSVRPRLSTMGACSPVDVEGWWAREMYMPRFESDHTDFLGAAAGLAAGLQKRLTPEKLLEYVAGAGCANPDADGKWIATKLSEGWNRYKPAAVYANWNKCGPLFLGPNEKVEA